MPPQTLGFFLKVLQELRLFSKEDYIIVRNLISYLYLFSISHSTDEDFIRRILYGRHETLSEKEYSVLRPLRKKRDAILWKFLGHITQDPGEVDGANRPLTKVAVELTHDKSSSNTNKTIKLGDQSLKPMRLSSEKSWRTNTEKSNLEKSRKTSHLEKSKSSNSSTPSEQTHMDTTDSNMTKSVDERSRQSRSTSASKGKKTAQNGMSGEVSTPLAPTEPCEVEDSSKWRQGKRNRQPSESGGLSNTSSSKPKQKVVKTASNITDEAKSKDNDSKSSSESEGLRAMTLQVLAHAKEIQTLRDGVSLLLAEAKEARQAREIEQIIQAPTYGQAKQRARQSQVRSSEDDQEWRPDVVSQTSIPLRGNQARNQRRK